MSTIVTKTIALVNEGYQVIPLSTGTGVPLVPFKDKTITSRDVNEWSTKYHGGWYIALRCGNGIIALDFDIDDSKIADALRKAILKKYPTVPLRHGNGSRFACIFRAGESLSSLSNSKSNTYAYQNKHNQIELKANGLITIYGRHRETGVTYYWRNNEPLECPVSELPVLSKKVYTKLCDYFHDSYERANRERKSLKSSTKSFISSPTDWTNALPIKKFTDEEVKNILDQAEGNTREDWLHMGFALHVQYDGSPKGLKIWDEWSSRFDGYVSFDDCRREWSNFKSDGGMTLHKIERKIKRYRNPETEKKSIEDYLDDYVYINKGMRVGVLSGDVDLPLFTRSEMKGRIISHLLPSVKLNRRSKQPEETMALAFDLWFTHKDRKQVEDVKYYPIKQRIISNDRQTLLYWNTYNPPQLEYTTSNSLITYFIQHIDYLFGENKFLFMNWLAQLVQHPEKRFAISPLHVSIHRGTGRGWLISLMQKLVGQSNYSVTNMSEIANEQSFRGFLNETTLVVVNEAKDNSNKYEVNDSIKTLIADNIQNVNLKYGQSYKNMEIFARIFFASNYINSIALKVTERAIQCFINKNKPKSNEYYKTLYDMLINPDFVNQVYSYLMDFKVDESQLQRAKYTNDQKEVIMATKSQTAKAYLRFKDVIEDGIFIKKYLHQFITKFNDILHDESGYKYLITDHQKELNNLDLELIAYTRTINSNTIHSFSKDVARMSVNDIKMELRKSKKLFNDYLKEILDDNQD